MEAKSNVESLFHWLDNTSEIIQQHMDETYLDSLIITLEVLFYQDVADMDDIVTHKLQHALNEINISAYDTKAIHSAIQLAILKGMKDSTQQQHLMTPDSVSLIVGYFANQLMKDKQKVRIFDPASGSGNLLITVLDQLEMDMEVFASEVDQTLIQLAVLSANIQKKQIEFFHQDSLRPFLLDPVDLVISDLPVGYYPDDIRANNYELKADEGHSYAHHLFIEQSINYTKEAGYLILVIPESLFISDQADQLRHYLHDYAHIIGVVRLPESAFKSKNNMKSIVILQKKGKNTKDVKQPLLVQMPSFKNPKAMADILGQMNAWFKSYSMNRS